MAEQTGIAPYRFLGFPRTWEDFLRFPDRDMFHAFRNEDIKVDEYRENGSLVIKAEAPGIDPEKDVELVVRDGRLELCIDRRKESRVEDKDYICEEMNYGHFERTLSLPSGCTEKDVKATYSNGILEVRLPMPKADNKRIPVEVK